MASESARAVRSSRTAGSHVATISLVLCIATFVIWDLSFTWVKGDQHGVAPVFVSDGSLWIGPLFRGGEDAVRSHGWNIGVASWTRSQGVWGGNWTSFSIDLWCFIVLFAVPAVSRYRLIHRVPAGRVNSADRRWREKGTKYSFRGSPRSQVP
jgi:hypothetical protein